MTRPRRRIVWLALALVAWGAAVLPWRELWSAATFRVATDHAKIEHTVRFVDGAGRELTIIGTAHDLHVETDRYPLWQLASAIAAVGPEVLVVEVRPEALAAGRLGEGPIEMPFAVLRARERGIAVRGMDAWLDDFDAREDRMFARTLEAVGSTPRALVLTGFSHVAGFGRRLREQGWSRAEWSAEERAALFSGAVDRSYPRGLRAACEAAAAEAEQGRNGYSVAWAERRRRFAATLAQ